MGSVLEFIFVVFAIAIVLVFTFACLYGIMWVMKKYGGVTMTTNYGRSNQLSHFSKQKYLELSRKDPEGINRAIESCKRKLYEPTIENILDEYGKPETDSIFTKMGRTVGNIQNQLKQDGTSISLEKKLSDLDILRKRGVISEEEYNLKRKQIIENF